MQGLEYAKIRGSLSESQELRLSYCLPRFRLVWEDQILWRNLITAGPELSGLEVLTL